MKSSELISFTLFCKSLSCKRYICVHGKIANHGGWSARNLVQTWRNACVFVVDKLRMQYFENLLTFGLLRQAGLATCHSKHMARTERLLSQPLLQGIAIAWRA